MLLLVLFSTVSSADYLKHYWDGREAYRNKKYRESVVFLDLAIKAQPQSGQRVRWTGTHFETYLPHFHLGRALYELGEFDQAMTVWREAERQGKIRDRGNKRTYKELQRRLKQLEQQHLPEELERLRRDVESTVQQLEQLRGIGGLVRKSDGLEHVTGLLDEALEDVSTADSSGEFASLGKADKALREARLRLLRALDASERRQRELRREQEASRVAAAREALVRAEGLLEAGECHQEARAILLATLAEGPLPAELQYGPGSLPILLSRAHEQCGDLLGAEQYLALSTGVTAADRKRVAEGRLRAFLAQVDVTLRAGTCDTAAIVQLEELGDQPRVRPRLARAYANCHLVEQAAKALASQGARDLRLTERIAELRQAADPVVADAARTRLQRARKERGEERALSAYLLARTQVDRGGCAPDAIASMKESLPDLPTVATSGSAAWVRPELDLARAYRACGNREQTLHYLQQATASGQGSKDDLEQLSGWLERTEALDIYSESHALLVGVATYDDANWGPLPEVLEDLADVEAQLQGHGFAVQKLIDPTHEELTKALTAFYRKKRRPDSRLVFYYGGHGHTEINDYLRLGYIVPADTPFPGNAPEAEHLDYLVSMDGFEGFAKQTAASHAMFLFDSCFSGTIFDATKSRFRMNKSAEDDPSQALARPVRLFVTAGDETEMVPAESVFRAAVVRALEGFADEDTDGLILGAELGSFVATHGASARNTPKWGMLEAEGFDSGDMAFRIPDYDLERRLTASDSAAAAELALWRLTSQSPRDDDLQQYLERYPEGRFVDAAEWMIRRRGAR